VRLAEIAAADPELRFHLIAADEAIDFTEANLDLAIRLATGPGEHEGVKLAAGAHVTVAAPEGGAETPISWPNCPVADGVAALRLADAGLAIDAAGVGLGGEFGNLCSNAVRYTPAGGEVGLSWKAAADGGAVFAVRDTGIGIEPQHLPRLTERFYRVDRSRSRETGGTGLGLAIVKHVVNRHAAKLEVSSEPGRGSCFSVIFPDSRVRAAQTAPVESNAARRA